MNAARTGGDIGAGMVFSSTVFLFAFLPAVLVLYYLPVKAKREYRNAVLLLASLLFYAWGEPVFVFVMLLSVGWNGWVGIRMEKEKNPAKRKAWLTAAIVSDVMLIFVFKYLGFVTENIAAVTKNSALKVEIALPIGISFFTFQIMSYVFDVYYGTVPAQKRISRLALYVSMFPQLIAGPIVRYETVERELSERNETAEDVSAGMARFIVGLAKKTMLANYTGLIADSVFALPHASMAAGTAWLGAIAYTLQIYFDFSGYSDMAIGLGRMFGFRFEENFNYPYIASSVTDFWRRWHISLSGWFRDYVYIPLGGSRGGKKETFRNLFVVWLLTGIWHGANWTFVAWGLYFFVLLTLEKVHGLDQKNNVLTHLYTLLFVVIGWVLFRSDSIGTAVRYLGAMAGRNGNGWSDTLTRYFAGNGAVILIPAAIACFPVVPWMKKRFRVPETVRALLLLLLFGGAVLACVKSTYNPFIYFNF